MGEVFFPDAAPAVFQAEQKLGLAFL